MYTLKKLSLDSELNQFRFGYAESFSKRSKVAKRELSIDELRSSSIVYGLYKNDKMISGFILNYYPSRCLESFSAEEQRKIVDELGENNVCELVGIWKDSKEKSAATTLTMWTYIITKTLGLGRPYIFGCNRNEKVGKEYYYQAEYQVVSAPESELTIFYYTRKQFLKTFFNSLFKFINKKKHQSPNMKEAV